MTLLSHFCAGTEFVPVLIAHVYSQSLAHGFLLTDPSYDLVALQPEAKDIMSTLQSILFRCVSSTMLHKPYASSLFLP